MLRRTQFAITLTAFFLLQSPAFGQEDEETQLETEPAGQQAQQRRARIQELRQLDPQQREERRAERRKQLESLSDEQRQALQERRRLRESQRPQRRRPQAAAQDDDAA